MKYRLMSAVLTVLCLSSAAQAQNNWNVAGSGCVPTGETVSSAIHKTSVSTTKFANGTTGTIELMCPMQRFNSGTSVYNLKLTYEDSTGMGTTASVVAQVYRMANTSTTAVQLGSVTSNSSAVSGVNTIASSDIAHTFDFEANIYWVRVLVKRAATGETVVFHSAVLDGTAF